MEKLIEGGSLVLAERPSIDKAELVEREYMLWRRMFVHALEMPDQQCFHSRIVEVPSPYHTHTWQILAGG